MTQNETKDIELPKVESKDPIQEEQTRLAVLLMKESPYMAAKYKTLIQSRGSLLTESMTYAYSKGINDAIKLILKENSSGKTKVPNTEST